MTTILTLAAITAFCWGVYTIACEIAGCPEAGASKALLGAAKAKPAKPGAVWENYLNRAAKKLAPHIPMDDLREQKIREAISIAGLACTPREYMARCPAGALFVLVCGLILSLINPVFLGIAAILAVAVGLYLYYSVFDAVKKRRKIIEREVPQFTLSLAQHLKTDRDVLRILTSYRKVAGPEFGAELDRTIATMRSGNYEDALLRLAARVGSPLLSEVVRGLIGTLRGDDQTIYFEMLSHDMRKVEQNQLEKEAEKQPAKIRKYSMLMLLCIILIYAVVLVTEMIGSLGAIF